MATKHVKVTVQGKTPLLMNRFPMEEPEIPVQKMTNEEQCEHSAYRHPETDQLYVPGKNVRRALISGAKYSKGKGRSTLSTFTAASVFLSPEYLILEYNGKKVKKYVIDRQPVVNPTTKGRIIRCRPRFDEWQITFTLEWDNRLITEVQLRKIVDDTFNLVGILDFRPEKKGLHGRGMIITWEKQ